MDAGDASQRGNRKRPKWIAWSAILYQMQYRAVGEHLPANEFQKLVTSVLRIQHSRIPICERTRPLFFGRGIADGASHHQGNLPADVVDA